MHRRSMLAVVAAVPLSGCGALGFGSDAYLDDEIESGNVYTFDADAGDVEITIEVTDAGSPDDDDADESVDVASIQIRFDGSPVFAESVDEGDERTFETAFEEDGEYEILTTGGTADVRIGAA